MSDDVKRRVVYVRMALRLETADQLVELDWIAPSQWHAFRKAAGPDHYALGFTPPYLVGGRLRVFACAEVLAAAAEHLEDRRFFEYVSGVRTHIHLHISQMEVLDLHPELVEVGVLAEQRSLVDLDFSVYESVRQRVEAQ